MNGIGFYPAFKDFATIMQEGNLIVIQNMGYSGLNSSHLRVRELLVTASSGFEYVDLGWLGRFLDNILPQYLPLY